jgi:hypothetical protein
MGQCRLERHLFEQSGILLRATNISQRRQRLPWELLRDLLGHCLRPLADPRRHREAFYHGYRLIGLDGTCFGVHNVPRLVQALGDVEQVAVCADAAKKFVDDHLNVIAEPLAKSLAHSGIVYLTHVSAALFQRVGPCRQAVGPVAPVADCAGCAMAGDEP